MFQGKTEPCNNFQWIVSMTSNFCLILKPAQCSKSKQSLQNCQNVKICRAKISIWLKVRLQKLCTDLDSLMGNFDCGYFTNWKFSNFPATLILREINFG